jgi:phage/plasmid-like protein (TIGR03299 family)
MADEEDYDLLAHATRFPGDTPFETVLADIGADFQPTLVPLQAVTFNPEGAPLFHSVPGSYGILNQNTGELIKSRENAVVVGSRYNPVAYSELKVWFEAFRAGAPVKSWRASMLDNGSRVYMSAELDIDNRVTGTDTVDAFATLGAGLDLKSGITGRTGGIRPFCANQIAMMVREAKAKGRYLNVRHTSNAVQAMKQGGAAIRAMQTDLQDTIQLFRVFARTRMDDAAFADMLDTLAPIPEEEGRGRTIALRLQDRLTANFEDGRGIREAQVQGTAWAAYNAITEYTTHQQSVRAPEGTSDRLLLERKLDSVWDGIGADFNRRTLEYVRAFVGEGAA